MLLRYRDSNPSDGPLRSLGSNRSPSAASSTLQDDVHMTDHDDARQRIKAEARDSDAVPTPPHSELDSDSRQGDFASTKLDTKSRM